MAIARDHTVERIPVDHIMVAGDRRAVNESAVERLMESIRLIGLQTPITIRCADAPDPETGEIVEGAWVIVTGRHRLEACRRLGHTDILAVVSDRDEIDAELWEISENLHRSELPSLERDVLIARWIKLNEKRVLSQSATKLGRPEGGTNAAARGLGIKRDDAHRAVKVASLSDEAKQTAREVGLDDNRTALLAAARKTDPGEQSEALRERAARPHKVIDIPEPKDWSEVEAEQKRSLMRAWNAASPDVQQWFRDTVVDSPIMDQSAA